jgi:hypothetical protein
MNPKDYSHNFENYISSLLFGATCLYSRRQRTAKRTDLYEHHWHEANNRRSRNNAAIACQHRPKGTKRGLAGRTLRIWRWCLVCTSLKMWGRCMNNYNNLNTSTSTGVYVYTVLISQNICFKRVMESQVVSYVIECASLINNRERSKIMLVPLRFPLSTCVREHSIPWIAL